jgi:hypothetical protein
MRKFILILIFVSLLGCTPPRDTLDSRNATFEQCNAISQEYMKKAEASWNLLRANNYWLRALYWKINARRMQNEAMDRKLEEFMKEFKEHLKNDNKR